ncbi:GNAT family N-acetyltransferase [Streptosporangium sp. NPDC000396]|uniref:GNAT family N-acetyltransferase n=1 Tax=Streptosporangium sp. NPDC000396 TaxID=3366185 RepID=UPI00369573E8
MTDRHAIAVTRWRGRSSAAPAGLSELLAAYHLQTEAEKGTEVAGVAELPERYRAEVLDPRAAFAGDAVLMASTGDTAVGCVVVAAPREGRAEIKRLWVNPVSRGHGVASALVRAALDHAREAGAGTVRLSVWDWRTNAIALYEKLGFTVTDSWDDRDRLVCMEHPV